MRQFTGVDRALVSSTMYLLTLSINITRVFLLTLIISLHSVNTRRPWNVFTNSLLLNGKCSRFWTATATGLDQLPAWFLRIGAPAFYKPITRLFNMSIKSSIIPHQWKHAVICPVPMIASPHEKSHYRPISITPVLSRLLERIVVRQFLYPAIISPPTSLSFTDLYAFCPQLL